MKPTRSAKRTETSRRSAGGPTSVGVADAATAPSALPHSPQNFMVGAFAVPQLGQVCASALPHSPQNFRPASFSEPQDEHLTTSATCSLYSAVARPLRARTTLRGSRRLSTMDELVLAWYGQNGRDLPWRKTTDPYAILVSEVMLQQTQVERVVPRYDGLARALADRRRARRGAAGRRDPRVAGARVQPARTQPAPRRARTWPSTAGRTT